MIIAFREGKVEAQERPQYVEEIIDILHTQGSTLTKKMQKRFPRRIAYVNISPSLYHVPDLPKFVLFDSGGSSMKRCISIEVNLVVEREVSVGPSPELNGTMVVRREATFFACSIAAIE